MVSKRIFILLTVVVASAALRCDYAERNAVRRVFKEWKGSNCPSWFWLKHYNLLYPPEAGEQGFVMDVGCNLGYSSAKLFRTFMPEWGFGPRDVFEFNSAIHLEGLPQDATCGACNDCREDDAHIFGEHPWPRLDVHCFEPSKNNFLRLLATRAKFASRFGRRWHLHNVAMDSRPGLVKFPAEECGELCSLDEGGNTILGHEQTLAVSVDSFVGQMKNTASRGVLLKIDTEGHDPSVLRGAEQTIRDGVFDMITFEHHGIGDWAKTNLSTVVRNLGRSNYFCFYDGDTKSLPMSGGCFAESMNAKAWSNMVCFHKRLDELIGKIFASSIDHV